MRQCQLGGRTCHAHSSSSSPFEELEDEGENGDDHEEEEEEVEEEDSSEEEFPSDEEEEEQGGSALGHASGRRRAKQPRLYASIERIMGEAYKLHPSEVIELREPAERFPAVMCGHGIDDYTVRVRSLFC